jgi:hypothetical protein
MQALTQDQTEKLRAVVNELAKEQEMLPRTESDKSQKNNIISLKKFELQAIAYKINFTGVNLYSFRK